MPNSARSRPPPGNEPRSSLPPSAPTPGKAGLRAWVVLGVLLLGVWIFTHFANTADNQPPIAYSTFYQLVTEQKVAQVSLRGLNVVGKFKAPTAAEGQTLTVFHSMVPAQEDRELLPLLREKGVKIEAHSEEQPLGIQLLMSLAPFALIVGLWVFLSPYC